ncbi:MAG: hypothetical protein HFF08_01135 [Oscillospiraceae bacterium]|nr:hypothetical protein [Oscillospiraceae bacterium]
MGKWKRILAFLLSLCCAPSLSGCLFRSGEELYALPRQPQELYELQKAIDALMTPGTVCLAPTAGANRQPIQLADLDGDGLDEAIVFLKTGGDMPLKTCILDQAEDGLACIATIEGDGTGFATAEYAQIDGKPGLEIILGRQVNDQVLQSMSVYALREGRAVELMSASYSAYTTCDLNNDGNTDLFLIRLNAEEGGGVAEYYRYTGEQIEREPEASMSLGAGAVKRILTGKVAGGVPAVFVASLYGEDSIVTDIFALRGKSFLNITTAGAAGTSAGTVRNYYVYGTDIDRDGVIELPQPIQLPSRGGAEDAYWIIEWYKMDLYGRCTRETTTYHNYSGGWYVTLPDEWSDTLTISRSAEVSGVRGYVFSHWHGAEREPEEIFTIYPFTGEGRDALATGDGRFLLKGKGDVSYAASLGTAAEAENLTPETLKEMFNFIWVDWNTGEV